MTEKTNEEKVAQFWEEIEAVFSTKEQNINFLNRIDEFREKGDTESIEALERLMVGRYHKQYWLRLEIDEPQILNIFIMNWLINGKSIAGVKATVLDFGGVVDKADLKRKMVEFIETL